MASDGVFVQGLQQLEAMGLLDSLLPFLLIFTIVFAVLQNTHILGRDRKNFNVIVALVLSLMAVIPHVMNTYPPGADVILIINSALPNVGVVIIAIIMLLLIMGAFGAEIDITGSGFVSGAVPIVALGIILFIFGTSAGWWSGPGGGFGFFSDPENQAVLVVIIVFALIIFFVTGGSNKGLGDLKIGDIFKKITK